MLKALEQRLGYGFENQRLLKESLTHKSCKESYNNERLEFLGDAVLDLIVGEYLYSEFKDVAEGELSKLRASLVNEAAFAKLAKMLDLGAYIFISKAEERNKGRQKPSLLSDAFEALMGAIYLEAGLEKVREIAITLIESAYDDITMDAVFKDHKTMLQELTQARFAQTPVYEVVASFGPDHLKEFEIAVKIENEVYGQSRGKSKKDAQQKAAKIALDKLK